MDFQSIADTLCTIIDRAAVRCDFTLDEEAGDPIIQIAPPVSGPATMTIALDGPSELVVEVGLGLRFEWLAVSQGDVEAIVRNLSEVAEAVFQGHVHLRGWCLQADTYFIIGKVTGRSRTYRCWSIRDFSREAEFELDEVRGRTDYAAYPVK